MSNTYTCDTVNDLLARNDSMFGAWIHEALKEQSPWYRLVDKESYPEGRGYTLRDLTVEGITTASAEDDWATISASNGATINPLSAPSLTELSWGQSYTSWSPKYKGYKTPCVSLDDLRFDHEVQSQITKTVNQLTQVTDEILSNRFRYEYARVVPQISAKAGFGNANGIVGLTDTTLMAKGIQPPTSTLNQTWLDRIYDYILRNGSGSPQSRVNIQDGAPVLGLITSRDQSDNVIRASGVRDDVRWGDPGELLKPLGVTRVFRGFAHIIDTEIPRFTYADNTWTRVLPWRTVATDSGNKREYNPSYDTADYELNYIYVRDAMKYAVIKDTSAKSIAGASFEDHPYYYSANAFWWNVKSESNPLGKIGRWLLIAAGATHPYYPIRGMTVMVKRCPNDQTNATCYYA